ncbi:MAG TPA: PIN domain-containing protein [Verrucomicrobiota bacterium]|nr:PIN domain-containing protein [Verrucomicrobiota bacterium]HOG88503.1 PIN domain-containing protein [Verrucomicrobiota bacterium]HOR72881.1 PIN domain-containing protein [Verrucomicrobiota bacterium]HOU89197.1 PIN domain-containing protein [Verrucomicrobiota bacterium]HPV12182.1 PIN domain-containing protein [Verrucomicrobiota bacterium]
MLDTGPLVAFLNRNDWWHDWAKAQMGALPPPLFTCEPVLTEACFLIQRNGGQPADVLKKLQAGVIEVALEIDTEASALETLMRRYEDTPMSLADACLVRLSELHSDCLVFTLDKDFRRYRRHGRQVIPLLAPG